MDRQTQIEVLVDHFRKPRHKGTLPGADAIMPGGNPGCGDLVTVHLTVGDDGRVEAMTFEGEGCTISQAAASILAVKVNREHPTLDELAEGAGYTYEKTIDRLGREVVGFRERCATLALGTLKMAAQSVATYRRLRASGKTDAEIRELVEAMRAAGGRSGIVFGDEATRQAGAGTPHPDPL